jgi:maltose alpha-D-glucosyltransferase/alpha-amylase
MALAEVDSGIEPATYFTPFALLWEEEEDERRRALAPVTIARVRQQAKVGVLCDAAYDGEFCLALVDAIERQAELATAGGKIRFQPTQAFAQLVGEPAARRPVTRPPGSSSNSVVQLGEQLFLKAFRRLRTGLNPELEVGRFLTDVAHFDHCVPTAGSVEYVGSDGTTMTLALLQAYVPNQGDGWSFSVDYLERLLDQHRVAPAATADAAEAPKKPAEETPFGSYAVLAQTLGTRTAQMHLAFAAPGGGPAFDPEPISAADVAAWRRRVADDVAPSLDLLARRLDTLTAAARARAEALLAQRAQLLARAAAHDGVSGTKIRHHGDYHLGQVLIRDNDFVIIDFEGEPARPFNERRQKHSPLRDVAGMLRSFSYVAAAALERVPAEGPERERLAAFAAAWESVARRAFLTGYRDTVAASTLLPDFDAAAPLLRLFELEKALYELRYEIENRPTWIEIPLRGLAELVEERS